MKLKKIASLMLAGVMAVSMLAGCNTTSNGNDQPTQPEEPTTPATGYSATFEDRLSALADANISMSDSDELNAALQTAMDFASNSKIAWDYNWDANNTVKFIASSGLDDQAQVAKELIKGADTDRESMGKATATSTVRVLNPLMGEVAYDKDNVDVVMLYAVDGGLSTSAAVMEVADKLDGDIKALVRSYDAADNQESTHDAVYTYTGSVSADTITLDADHGKSVTFVAVEIVRALA